MSGWYLLVCGVVCLWGAVQFLGFVAGEVGACERALSSLEEQEEKAAKKRRADLEVVDVVATGRLPE